MILTVQIVSSLYSFVYGMFLGIIYNLNYNLLYNNKNLSKIIFNVFFVVDFVLLYFIILKNINDGIIHPYFYLLIMGGFLITFKRFKKIRKYIKIVEKAD